MVRTLISLASILWITPLAQAQTHADSGADCDTSEMQQPAQRTTAAVCDLNALNAVWIAALDAARPTLQAHFATTGEIDQSQLGPILSAINNIRECQALLGRTQRQCSPAGDENIILSRPQGSHLELRIDLGFGYTFNESGERSCGYLPRAQTKEFFFSNGNRFAYFMGSSLLVEHESICHSPENGDFRTKALFTDGTGGRRAGIQISNRPVDSLNIPGIEGAEHIFNHQSHDQRVEIGQDGANQRLSISDSESGGVRLSYTNGAYVDYDLSGKPVGSNVLASSNWGESCAVNCYPYVGREIRGRMRWRPILERGRHNQCTPETPWLNRQFRPQIDLLPGVKGRGRQDLVRRVRLIRG